MMVDSSRINLTKHPLKIDNATEEIIINKLSIKYEACQAEEVVCVYFKHEFALFVTHSFFYQKYGLYCGGLWRILTDF